MSMVYTQIMNITNWENDEILRLITAKGRVTQKILLDKYTEQYGIDIPQPTFSNKIRRNCLKVVELQNICKLLGYELIIKKIDNWLFIK